MRPWNRGGLKGLHQTLKERNLKENTFFDLDVDIKVTRNIAKHPLHHVTYAAAKFKASTPNGLRGDAFTLQYIICHLTPLVNRNRDVIIVMLNDVIMSRFSVFRMFVNFFHVCFY